MKNLKNFVTGALGFLAIALVGAAYGTCVFLLQSNFGQIFGSMGIIFGISIIGGILYTIGNSHSLNRRDEENIILEPTTSIK